MNMNLFITFVILNILNVIIQTVKSLATVKCGKVSAAIINAIAYGFYTIVLIYMVCELPLWLKATVVAICNLIGVYVVKFGEEKARKDKLWKVELTIKPQYANELEKVLDEMCIPNSYIDLKKYYLFNVYCATQKESQLVKELVSTYKAKYFVLETKSL